MDQPTVSIVKMSMNEGIASTCCYRSLVNDADLFFSVLNGGYIGSIDTITKNFSQYYPSNPVWMSIAGDYPLEYTGREIRYVNGIPHVVIPEVLDAEDENGTSETLVSINQIKNFLSGGASCKHADTHCAYYEWPYVHIENAHIDAKIKHSSGGPNWQKPHAAVQFSS